MGYGWIAATAAKGSVRFRDAFVAEVDALEGCNGLGDIAYLTCSCSTDRLSLQLMR